MSGNQSSTASGGVGFAGLLTLVFIVLKLCKVIAWKWVWVLSPLWISFGLVILILIFYGIVVWFLTRRR
jgi:hypothetical protein